MCRRTAPSLAFRRHPVKAPDSREVLHGGTRQQFLIANAQAATIFVPCPCPRDSTANSTPASAAISGRPAQKRTLTAPPSLTVPSTLRGQVQGPKLAMLRRAEPPNPKTRACVVRSTLAVYCTHVPRHPTTVGQLSAIPRPSTILKSSPQCSNHDITQSDQHFVCVWWSLPESTYPKPFAMRP